MDILGNLPESLSSKILSLLSIGDLARAANVSTKWRDLIESPTVWDTILREKGHLNEKLVPLSKEYEGLGCMGLLWRGETAVWRMRRGQFAQVELKGVAAVGTLGNGALVAALRPRTPFAPRLEVYDVNDPCSGAASPVDVFDLPVPEEKGAHPHWALQTFESGALLQAARRCLVGFTLSEGRLQLSALVLHSGLKFVSSHKYSVPSPLSCKADWELLGVVGGDTVVLSTVGFYVHFFSLSAGVEVGSAFLDDQIEASAITPTSLLVALPSRILAFDAKARLQFQLDNSLLIGPTKVFKQRLWANERVFLSEVWFSSESGEERWVRGWGWSGSKAGPDLPLPPGRIALPSGPHPILLHFSAQGRTDCIHLPTGATLWTAQQPNDVLIDQVFLVGRSFLVAYTDSGSYMVFDYLTGAKLFSVRTPQGLRLRGANQKLSWFSKFDEESKQQSTLLYLFTSTIVFP